MEEKEVELIDYLNIIWKRKWLILLSTLAVVLAAGVISLLLPQKWEVDSLLKPSIFLVQTAGGQFEEVVIIEPDQIAEQINQAAYNSQIASELGMSLRDLPRLRSEHLGQTKLVRIFVREKDIERAKKILSSLLQTLKSEIDQKAEVEIKGIEEEIKTLEKKLEINKQRQREIEKEMAAYEKRIQILEEEQRSTLKKESRGQAESLALLLYSTEIENAFQFLNGLKELLNEKKFEEEDLIKQIEELKKRKGRIDFTQIVKTPTPSLSPVSPQRILIVAVTAVLGVLLFILIALFLEYLEKKKIQAFAGRKE